ncbi:hypothetical protein ACH347_31910 [Saccharopolyspora sp. 5N102]|uniref:hypothetical protein n=1 Tax=Saccharopolyspora sp. 5N102 TaxID=3375155 RepID=UPI0037ADCA00
MPDSAAAAPTTSGDELSQWIDDVQPLVMRLDTCHVDQEFEFQPDMSADSLLVLEEALVNSYRPEGGPDAADFLRGAMAYLGESLMMIAGGRWGWAADERPVVLPDPELHLEPVDPLNLIVETLESPVFGVFTGSADMLRHAVLERQAEHPGWKPVKEPIPGLDPWGPEDQHPWLAGWLATRTAQFDAWVADTGVDKAAWDFSPASLDVLGRLVTERYPGGEAFERDEDAPFAQGAIWYAGEVGIRNRSGAWRYREPAEGLPPEEAERNIYLLRPHVVQPAVREGGGDIPFFALLQAARERNPEALRTRLGRYAAPTDSPVTYRGVQA